MYSATDNPFHDVNLSQQFRWHKKAEKERKQGLTVAEAQRRDILRRQEAKEELERLNKRRADREAEQRIREQEEIKMQRLNESAQMSEWLAKDDDFQLDQERQRAIIRIKERRAKAVDFLALNLRYGNPDPNEDSEFDLDAVGVEIDLDEPYNIFDVGIFFRWCQWFVCLLSPQNLSPQQIDELHDDVQNYLALEKSDYNLEFWTVRSPPHVMPDKQLTFIEYDGRM